MQGVSLWPEMTSHQGTCGVVHAHRAIDSVAKASVALLVLRVIAGTKE